MKPYDMQPYIERNSFLEKIQSGAIPLGIQLRSRSPLIAELAGYLGFDFLYIETEHFACSDESAEALFRAAELSGITPWIRLTSADPENICHYLDLGAQGIIVPHLETAEQARSLVDAGKYPPAGHRGHCMTSRPARFGLMDADAYIEAANRNCLMIGMIETIKGVENLEAILDEGIDLIRVGRGDLSLDMGLRGKQDDPRFVDVLKTIIEIADKKGIPVGTSAATPENALYYKELGFHFLSLMSDIDHLMRTLPILKKSVEDALHFPVRSA